MTKNKKADERVLSIYLFIIYIIVSVGIVSGVILFYGSPLDIRTVESGILANKVIDCLTEQGELKGGVLDKDFDLMSSCNLNFKDNTQKYQGEEQYGIKIEFYEFDSCSKTGSKLDTKVECKNKLREEIKAGRIDFFEFCGSEAEEAPGGEKIPKCDIKAIYVLNNQKGVIVRIISAVGKVQNV